MRTHLVLVALLLAGCASTPLARPTGPASTSPASTSPAAATSPAVVPASVSSGRHADAIAASVRLPPGSVRVAQAPTAAIGMGTGLYGVPDADRTIRTAFWRTSASAASTLAFLVAHPPEGMGTGNCCSEVRDDTSAAKVIEYVGKAEPGEADVDLQVAVGAVPGGGTGVRVGVEIHLVQSHGPDQVLNGVRSVVLSGSSPSGSPLAAPVTLNGAPAARLAADVNALPAMVGKAGCLPPGADITMTFSTSQGQRSAEFNGPCDVVWMGATDDDPGLSLSTRLEADLGAALGLPASSLAG
jgi:hypothetical protein